MAEASDPDDEQCNLWDAQTPGARYFRYRIVTEIHGHFSVSDGRSSVTHRQCEIHGVLVGDHLL